METLLTPSTIKLFGRVMPSLQYYDDTSQFGNNNFLQQQLSKPMPTSFTSFKGSIDFTRDPREIILPALSEDDMFNQINIGMIVTGITPEGAQIFLPGTHIVYVKYEELKDGKPGNPLSISVSSAPLLVPNIKGSPPVSVPAEIWYPGVSLARIYAFSFEGALYSMPKPAIFIVHSLGRPITARDGNPWQNNRSSVDQSGVVAREWEFAGAFDLVYWEYEKGDFSLRLDTEAGQLEQILLAASLRSGADRSDRSGAGAEVRSGAGAEVRSGAGAEVRSGRR